MDYRRNEVEVFVVSSRCHKINVGQNGFTPAEIQSRYLPNTRRTHYRVSILLGLMGKFTY
jgi:hypothetical protein